MRRRSPRRPRFYAASRAIFPTSRGRCARTDGADGLSSRSKTRSSCGAAKPFSYKAAPAALPAIAIQLAKHIGSRIITTASAENHAYVKSLGADQVVDYKNEDFTKIVKDVDAVFQTVGGEVTQRSRSRS